jgi:hypothetical protein
MKLTKLLILLLLLSLKGFTQTTITSDVTINQDWISNNSTGPWTISGTVTVTFGENFTITNTSQYFIISGSNVTIDGAGKTATISGVTEYPGLVDASNTEANSSLIKNIGVNSTGITSLSNGGGYISQSYNKATISNCFSTGEISGEECGGIAGKQNTGSISYCYSTGPISGMKAGGIAGRFNHGSISNCYSTGPISGIEGAGGIVGRTNYANITNCFSTGEISGYEAGGIAGRANGGNITNCYSSGKISGYRAGGIAGYLNEASAEITDSRSSGSRTGSDASDIASAGTFSNAINVTPSIENTWDNSIADQALTGLGTIWNTTTTPYTLLGPSLSDDSDAPSLSVIAPLATLTSCSGASSTNPITFGVSGSGLTESVTITAPSDFEISTDPGGTYSSSLTLTNTSSVSETIYVRLTSSATVGTISGSITATSSSTTATTTVSGTVNAIPSISIIETDASDVPNDAIICDGSSVTLTASGTAAAYLWSTSDSDINNSITPSPSTTTTYTVTGTTSGCSNTASVTITVNALPSVNITVIDASGDPNDAIICDGSSVTLTASGTTADYLWSTGEYNTSSITSSPNTTTTYTVTAIHPSGCSNTASITITVNAIPTISISESDASGSSDNDSKVCIGGVATLTAIGGDTYTWSTLENTSLINPSITTNTTYTVTGISAAGCSNITSVIITVESLPALSYNSISLSYESTYLITKTTSVSSNESWTVSGNINVNNGYVTAGTIPGDYEVGYTDGCAQTVSATVYVAPTSSLPAITDGLASYKFNNNPQGPLGSGNVIYMGYNGFNYSSTTRPTKPGFYKANNVSGNSAGSPFEYDIFRCTTCGTVSSFGTRPQGTLSGNTSGTGQLTYTSSNGGGPFTIVYQATGASPVTVKNISSTVAFNVVTPTITTSYKLISVTDESTNASTDFSGIAASITIPHFIGESFGGGIVFYVDENNHGLIAATSDQSGYYGIQWYNGSYTTTGAIATAIGTGFANTNTIINSQGGTATSYAAGLARAYNGGGNNDWYLPSKDELNLMYTNIGKGASSPNYNIGGFRDEYYWSSSESSNEEVWIQSFSYGNKVEHVKNYTRPLRAIRSF